MNARKYECSKGKMLSVFGKKADNETNYEKIRITRTCVVITWIRSENGKKELESKYVIRNMVQAISSGVLATYKNSINEFVKRNLSSRNTYCNIFRNFLSSHIAPRVEAGKNTSTVTPAS
jgi:hypothetical protein